MVLCWSLKETSIQQLRAFLCPYLYITVVIVLSPALKLCTWLLARLHHVIGSNRPRLASPCKLAKMSHLLVFVPCRFGGTMRCLAARVNYKTLIIICALFILIAVLLWNRCSNDNPVLFQRSETALLASKVGDASSSSSQQQPPQPPEPPPVVGVASGIKYEDIDCLINDDVTVKCRREGKEVYMPFSWVQKYFEVYGKVMQYDGFDRLEFQHSYSKNFNQRESYRPSGVFMSFEAYNVENRDRVKCVSGVEGKHLYVVIMDI